MTRGKGHARWGARVLAAIHRLAAHGHVRFTLKATQEIAALDMGLDERDALRILAALRLADLAGRVESARTPEWLYVFKPMVGGTVLYLKLILRADCVVISFHKDEGDADEEE